MLSKRLCAGLAVAGLAAIGVAAAPTPAEAWWRGGWCCGFGVGFVLPPIVVAPPVYAPLHHRPTTRRSPPIMRRRRPILRRGGYGYRRTGRGRSGYLATGREARTVAG